MNKTSTTDKRADGTSQPSTRKSSSNRRSSSGTDWTAFDAMTDVEATAAALSDPDAQPITREQFAKAKRKSRCFSIRIALRMTQEQFAEAFRIPVGTIRDWEQLRTEPDQAAKAYLKVIAVNPEYVKAALSHRPGSPKPKAG